MLPLFFQRIITAKVVEFQIQITKPPFKSGCKETSAKDTLVLYMDYKFQVSNGKIIKTYNPLTVLNLTRSFLIDKNAFIEVYRKVQGRETKIRIFAKCTGY